MSTPLTLMAVHAHPDDESSSTGGILARYSDEGLQTVVVTCTNGELGDAPGGIKPGEEGHDEAEVARIRLDELERACETLGVAHLEMLGYHDSGMVDWEHKDRPDAFCNVAVDDAAERLSRSVRAVPTRRRRDLRRARRLRPPRSRPRQPRHDGRRRTNRDPAQGLLHRVPAQHVREVPSRPRGARSRRLAVPAARSRAGAHDGRGRSAHHDRRRRQSGCGTKAHRARDRTPASCRSRSGAACPPRRSACSLVRRPSSERTTPPARRSRRRTSSSGCARTHVTHIDVSPPKEIRVYTCICESGRERGLRRVSPGNLRAASRLATRRYDAELRESGLRITQVAILAQVRRHDVLSISELAAELSSERSVIARDVAVLERDGLLSVAIDPQDRRVRNGRAHQGRSSSAPLGGPRVATCATADARGPRPRTRGRPTRHLPCRRRRTRRRVTEPGDHH